MQKDCIFSQAGKGSVIQTYNVQTARRDNKYKDAPAEECFSKRWALRFHHYTQISLCILKIHTSCVLKMAINLEVTHNEKIFSLLQTLHSNLNVTCFTRTVCKLGFCKKEKVLYYFTSLLHVLLAATTQLPWPQATKNCFDRYEPYN